MLYRFLDQESWCELMEAMSSVVEGATHVILARAGRSHVSAHFDEYCKQSVSECRCAINCIEDSKPII